MTALTFDLERRGPFGVSGDLNSARASADAFYRIHGRAQSPRKLLSQTGKLAATESGYAVGIQLRPADASGLDNCAWSTAGCRAACVLETSFRGKSSTVRDGRTLRTLFLAEDPQAFVTLVAAELESLARKYGRILFRPNIASDIRWEYVAPDLFGIAGVFGYDYTKADPRKHRGKLDNYRLCYSVSEHPLSARVAAAYVAEGGTAAVVLRTPKHAVPATWAGMPAVDGDASDDRTADPAGCYVLLAVKTPDGKADRSGFVRELELTPIG